MNATSCTDPATALHHFAEIWAGDVADDVARALSCAEVDALAGLFRAAGREGMAHAWINAHAWHDDRGDAHYWTATETVRAHFEEVAATVPGIELREEDPHTFGAGHLVFYKHQDDARQDSRLAFTEICDPRREPRAHRHRLFLGSYAARRRRHRPGHHQREQLDRRTRDSDDRSVAMGARVGAAVVPFGARPRGEQPPRTPPVAAERPGARPFGPPGSKELRASFLPLHHCRRGPTHKPLRGPFLRDFRHAVATLPHIATKFSPPPPDGCVPALLLRHCSAYQERASELDEKRTRGQGTWNR